MKTTTKKIVKAISFMAIAIIATLISNPVYAQQTQNTVSTTAADQNISVTGKVTNEKGPLLGVNIMLKDSKIGIITDENGEFTFPKSLSAGDILVFSYLGYEKQDIKIDSKTTYINLLMSSDLIEMMGAPSADKPYKSKRSN
ncbi:MAG: hypothetical protein ACJA1H_000285 [Glaciecola sp.]|jgi:hypothetical protein